jgi:hypothetical protein
MYKVVNEFKKGYLLRANSEKMWMVIYLYISTVFRTVEKTTSASC